MLYNEDGEIIDNDNPPEWNDDSELTDVFMAVSDLYDTFFIDNEKELSFVGCPNKETEQKLRDLFAVALDLLTKKTMGNIR